MKTLEDKIKELTEGHNMNTYVIAALVELLEDAGIVTKGDVLKRSNKLKEEYKIN